MMEYLHPDNTVGYKHGLYCACLSSDPLGDITSPCAKQFPPSPVVICKCGKPATYEYEPSDWGYCDNCIDNHRGCSCRLVVKQGIEEIWNEEECRWENPESDYEMLKDEDGKELPCCEYKDLKYEARMLKEDMDKFTQVLVKIREELSYAEAMDREITIAGNGVNSSEAAAALNPVFKAFVEYVGYSNMFEEATKRGKRRAELDAEEMV